jgi:hypothetical protein
MHEREEECIQGFAEEPEKQRSLGIVIYIGGRIILKWTLEKQDEVVKV